jgi:hypothetical protein
MAESNRPRRVLNCVASKETERDFKDSHAEAAGLVAHASREALPTAVDLRAAWWTIGDQGETGSCVGWAVADGAIRYQMVTAGSLLPDQRLSVRYLWMAAKETDKDVTRPTSFIEPAGTFLKAALHVAQKYGVAEESLLPFGEGRLYPEGPEVFYALVAQRRISSYFSVGRPSSRWKRWLSSRRPVATRLDCDEAWMNCGGEGRLATYTPDAGLGGHATLVVGYDAEGYIIRNSWGTDWGKQGFAHVSYAYAERAFTEGYCVVI